ncbi:MAG: GerMN domain-containing protein [Erysipelotrichaceae bacterium]
MKERFQYKKQIIFLFAMLGFISYVSLKMMPIKEENNVMVVAKQGEAVMQVYLFDFQDTIIPMSVSVAHEMKTVDKIKKMIAMMSEPHGTFAPPLTKACKLEKVIIQDETAILTFNQKFLNYQKKQELKILEAITWGVTQFEDIKNIKLIVNEKILTKMPKAKTPILNPCNRSIGINNFESSSHFLHDSKGLTIYYTKKIDGKDYYVPKTIRMDANVNQFEESIQKVLERISVSSGLKQPLFTNDIKLMKSPQLENGTLKLSLNEAILAHDRVAKKAAFETLILSMSLFDGVKRIEVSVDDVVISLHGSNEDAIEIKDLFYNGLSS